MKQMSFYLFQIKGEKNSEMRKGIQRIPREGEADKIRTMKSGDIAVERRESVSGINAEVLNILEARSDDLPGRVDKKEGVNTDLPIEKGDLITQETMAMFASVGEGFFLVCQYNRYGAKAGSIAAYVGGGNFADKSLLPVIHKDMMKKFHQSDEVIGFRMRVATAGGAADWMAGSSMRGALKGGMQHDAGSVEVRLGYGKNKRGGPLTGIKELVPSVLKNMGDRLQMMQVSVREMESKAEPIDLLAHRIIHKVDEKELKKTDGQRYDYDSRKKAIIEAFRSPDFQNHMK